MRSILPSLLAACAGAPAAAPSDGLGVLHSYQDWVVGCDNHRRCEAQGYNAEGGEPAVIVVQRDGGPAQPARLRIGFGELAASGDGEAPQPPPGRPLELRVGPLRMTLPPVRDGFTTPSPAQAQALRPWLQRADTLQLLAGGRTWTISLAGATAALLKMDDLQGRVGGAPGLPVPAVAAIEAPRLPAPRPADAALAAGIRREVRPDAQRCPRLHEADAEVGEVLRLGERRVMVRLECWLAAYQSGSGAWVAADRAPFAPRPVRFEALPGERDDNDDTPTALELSREGDGTLRAFSSAKGRGIGDCVSSREWAWDGERFRLTEASVSPCRLFSAGGLALRLWQRPVR